MLLNDTQTLGNCGFTNQTARPQAPATVGLAFRLGGESRLRSFDRFHSNSSSPGCSFHLTFPFLSLSSQTTHLSSWGSSHFPPRLSFLMSWNPKIQAAQPTSRPSSEGRKRGRRRDTQREGWVAFWEVMPLQDKFSCVFGRSSAGHQQTWTPFVIGGYLNCLELESAC